MKKKNQTVLSTGQMKELICAIVQGIPSDLNAEEAQYWIGHKSELAKKAKTLFKKESKLVISVKEKADKTWLQPILIREHQCHSDFFVREFNLSKFEKTLEKYGQKKIQQWQELGLEPHFLPEIVLLQDNNFRGWKVKPENWYYQQATEGKILRNIEGELIVDKQSYKLEGITVLIDTRLKPAYGNGKQMYEDDNLLGSIIELLRKDKKIAKYEHGPQSSRFGVSADEWESQIKPALAKKLGLEINQVRLERAIEANIIPQLYSYMLRKDDGSTNTWVWHEEFFKDRDFRLNGGHSDRGGLAHVHYYWSGDHWAAGRFVPWQCFENWTLVNFVPFEKKGSGNNFQTLFLFGENC